MWASEELQKQPESLQNVAPAAWTGDLLFHCPAIGDVEQTMGHPGCFYHVVFQTSPTPMMTVYCLQEHARVTQRFAVWTSDCRYCLADLPRSVEDRKFPYVSLDRYVAGNFFGGLVDEKGALLSRAGVGRRKQDIGSLKITRAKPTAAADAKSPAADDQGADESETFVPRRLMLGLIPQALLHDYEIWRTSNTTWTGYPHDPKLAGETLFIQLCDDGQAHIERRRGTETVAVLLNPVAPGPIQALGKLLAGAETFAFMLFWGSSPVNGDYRLGNKKYIRRKMEEGKTKRRRRELKMGEGKTKNKAAAKRIKRKQQKKGGEFVLFTI